MRDQVLASLLEVRIDPRDGTAEARLRFASDLPVFHGHFPGMPIVPGVFFVEAARLLAERMAGRELAITAIEEAKFTAEVHPEDAVTGRAARLAPADPLRIDATFHTATAAACRVRLTLLGRGEPPEALALGR